MLKTSKRLNRIKQIGLIFLILSFIFTLAACSSKSAYKEDSAVRETSAYSSGFSSDSGQRGESTSDNIVKSEKVVRDDVKKIIKNGEISLEVKDVDEFYENVEDILNRLGGEEFNKSYRLSGGYKSMQLMVKIPPEKIDLFENELKKVIGSGRIRWSDIRSQDITSEYYDYGARLESYQASRDRVRELLNQADNVEDTLRIHAELSRLQAEIDSMQGQIKLWDNLVGMATITLYIEEEANPMKQTEPVGWNFSSPSEVWGTMKSGFINVVNWFYGLLLWLLIIIVSGSPIFIIGGIIFFFVRRKLRDRKEEGKSMKQRKKIRKKQKKELDES